MEDHKKRFKPTKKTDFRLKKSQSPVSSVQNTLQG